MKRIILIIFNLIGASLVYAADALPIQIQGISGKALKNVQEQLSVLKQPYGAHPSSPQIQDFIRRAPDPIRQALAPFGYFKPIIHTQQNQNTVRFIIDPGPALTIARVDVKIEGPGKNDPALQSFLQHFPLEPGQVLLTHKYERAKEKFFQLANNQGYLKASLEKKSIQINLQRYSADIILYFNTGPRYYFGSIQFAASPYAPDFLRRFVSLHPSDPFSSQQLMQFQQDLRNSHYFQEADVTPDFNSTDSTHIPIHVAIKPKKSQRFDAGIGYGTFTGPRLTLGTDFRRITNTGQHVDMQLKLSSVLSGFAAKYYIPGQNPLTEQYAIGANIQYFVPKNGTSFSQTLSASYAHTQPLWQKTYSLNYLNERYQVADQSTHQSQIFYPCLSFTRIKADNLLSPHSGHLFNFTLHGASETFFSKTNFFQAEMKGKYIVSPTKNSRVILRGDLGYTAVENLNQLPMTLRYFAGGLGSVRGYPYGDIGPGKYIEIASAEYQHRIVGNWSGALFYDVGNASNTFNGSFSRGDGLGLIYKSFLGPIQLYVGRALSKKDKPLSIEFSIGPDF